MFKKLLRSVRDLSLTTLLFSSSLYGYLYYRSTENQKRYLQSIQSQTLRDASRLSNDSFGISWGFQADDTIMSRIDSGDLLFIKYQCHQCLTPESMMQCYLKTSHYLEQEYHSVGCAFRDESNLYVLYNQFGETKAKTYCQLVSLPYIRQLALQKRTEKQVKAHKNIREQVDLEKRISESSTTFAKRVGKLLGYPQGVINSIDSLASGEQKINIRTDTNARLRSL